MRAVQILVGNAVFLGEGREVGLPLVMSARRTWALEIQMLRTGYKRKQSDMVVWLQSPTAIPTLHPCPWDVAKAEIPPTVLGESPVTIWLRQPWQSHPFL